MVRRVTGELLYGGGALNAGPRGCQWVQGTLAPLSHPILSPQKLLLRGMEKPEICVSICPCLLGQTLLQPRSSTPWAFCLDPLGALPAGPSPSPRRFSCESDCGWGFWLGWGRPVALDLSRGWGSWGLPLTALHPLQEGHAGHGPCR